MSVSYDELQKMKQIDIRVVDPETLVDITDIEIDTKKAILARVNDYISQVKNPYCVKVGEYVVKVGYSDCEETINDRMMQYIRRIAEIK